MSEQTDIRTAVDGLLGEIGRMQKGLADVNADYERRAAQLRDEFAPATAVFDRQIKALEVRLKTLVRGQQADLMGDADRVDLPHGAVLYTKEKHLKRIKGMLKRLKTHRVLGCIKTAESVDWEKVEKLPEDTIEKLGTEWKDKENFSYEVKAL